jgi:hypothetical protein
MTLTVSPGQRGRTGRTGRPDGSGPCEIPVRARDEMSGVFQ